MATRPLWRTVRIVVERSLLSCSLMPILWPIVACGARRYSGVMERPAEQKFEPLPRSPELMNRDDTSLLVVDMQQKLLDLIPEHVRIIWNARRLLDAAAALGVPIAATEQYPEKLSPTVNELKERIGHAPDKK